MVHAYNPSTREIQDQPELCLKKAKTNKKDQVSRNIFFLENKHINKNKSQTRLQKLLT